MPNIRLLFLLVVIPMIIMACAPAVPPSVATPQAESESTPQPTPTAASTTVAGEEAAEFTMRDLGVNLSSPLALVYGSDGYLWVTERVGKRVTRINPADGSAQVALEIPEAYQRTSQDGVLGLALHPELLQGTGNDYVYVAYVYEGEGSRGSQVNRRVKIVRYRYDPDTETLGQPLELMTDLAGSGDHNSGKLLIGADEKLYYTHGDQGNNQFGNACLPILAQVLPTAEEVSASDWSHYPGKVLRLNLDGSIPEDNPELNGVRSHVFTYGHRNVQGIAMSDAGLIYATEQGPKSDDEINLLEAGKNYGWPQVAGFQDDQAYVYANWSEAENCAQLEYSDFELPAAIPQQAESAWSHPDFVPPLHTFGTVPDDYNFHSPECVPQEWICWPTVAPTGLAFYAEQEEGVPSWGDSLLATALKTGTVYRLALGDDGRASGEEPIPLFKSINRYRDIVVGPDGRTFYVITDSRNWTLGPDRIPTDQLENPGTILEFTYTGGE